MAHRTRSVFLAWLAYGALQLVLLGAPGAAGRPGFGQRGARSQAEVQSLSLGKRLAAETSDRHAPTTSFAPAAYVRFDLPAVADSEALVTTSRQVPASEQLARPPARAPPTLS
jgi:hypothetical protein